MEKVVGAYAPSAQALISSTRLGGGSELAGLCRRAAHRSVARRTPKKLINDHSITSNMHDPMRQCDHNASVSKHNEQHVSLSI